MKIDILDRKRSTTRYAELYFYGLDNVEVVAQWFCVFLVLPVAVKIFPQVIPRLMGFPREVGRAGSARWRGGGFADTVQAFVPLEILDDFVAGVDGVLGQGACHVLSIRPQGGVEMAVPS